MSERYLFTDEQEALRAVVREFVAEQQPPERLRELIETEDAHDPEAWALLAGQLGLTGLLVPEEFGGAGAGHLELGVALEEMGAGLLCGPYLASAAFVAMMLGQCDRADQARLLPRIADGSTVATAALSGAAQDATALPVTAVRDGDGWALTGTEHTVLAGRTADVVLVPARTEGGVGFFTLRADATGLTRTALNGPDLTRRTARLEFDRTPAERLRIVGDPAAALTRTLDLAVTALAAEQVGAASRILEITTAHASQRYQFGRPIGSFQAVKHRCANMLLDVETARSAAYQAMWAAAGALEELPAAASVAKAYCSEAFVRVAEAAIQMHGGIGFTWEHPAHLYYRRAKSQQHFLGDPGRYLERLAEQTAS